MSTEYDRYLEQHKSNVRKSFDWMKEHISDSLDIGYFATDLEYQINFAHDESKSQSDEYTAYDAYFYGGNRSYKVVEAFRYAWLVHIHRNPHHWQHWVLINDDPREGKIVMDMPYNYIIEMICDWWAFSWQKGKLDEIFGWYDEHKNYMQLSDKTRKTVENILGQMKDALDVV